MTHTSTSTAFPELVQQYIPEYVSPTVKYLCPILLDERGRKYYVNEYLRVNFEGVVEYPYQEYIYLDIILPLFEGLYSFKNIVKYTTHTELDTYQVGLRVPLKDLGDELNTKLSYWCGESYLSYVRYWRKEKRRQLEVEKRKRLQLEVQERENIFNFLKYYPTH